MTIDWPILRQVHNERCAAHIKTANINHSLGQLARGDKGTPGFYEFRGYGQTWRDVCPECGLTECGCKE